MSNRTFKIPNNLLSNHTNRNVVYPISPVEQREVNTNVEIIEINNSSDECDENKDEENLSFAHAWAYIGREIFTNEDSYNINKAARERRRHNNENEKDRENTNTINETYERSPDHLYPSFYSLDRSFTNDSEYKSSHNRPVNCFTIPNKHGNSSTSSDDPNADIELIQCGDVITNRDYWNDNPELYDEEIFFTQDHQTDKRTIWIYSYKNKRILSENDYFLTNISSSCTSSDELEIEPTKDVGGSRIATPIPYNIPRLNFNCTSTLPTVTELTEPAKPSLIQADQTIIKETKPSNTHSWSGQEKSSTNRSVSTDNNSELTPTKPSPQSIKYLEYKRLDETKTNELVYCEPQINIITRTEDTNIETYNKELEPISAEINRLNHVDSNDVTVHLDSSNQLCEKPRIQIISNPIKGAEVSDPIEKLEGNWISGDTTNNEPSILYYDTANKSIDSNVLNVTHENQESVANEFFIRNLPLLKPAEWNEYMPITESIPSLELTIDTDMDTTKKSWFKKLFKCVRCFHKNKANRQMNRRE